MLDSDKLRFLGERQGLKDTELRLAESITKKDPEGLCSTGLNKAM